MKTENKTMYKFIAVWALILLGLWSCKDEMNKTGYDLLLPGDLISANKAIFNKNAISAYTFRDDKLRTNKPDNNLLGTLVDPVFGKTTTSFACQFRISNVPQFKQGDRIDSLVFYMTYSTLYGDTVTAQNIKAYELTTPLKYEDDASYYQDINLKGMSGSEVVGEINHRQRHRDSIYVANTDPAKEGTYKKIDTITVRIKIKNTLAQKLMDATFTAFNADPEDPNMIFLNLFKGLYIEPGDLTQGGAIVSMKPRALIMYTPKPTTATDTVKKEYATYYDVTRAAGRVNSFVHDYSTTSFAAHLDQQNQMDSLIYLQSTGGLSSKIYIPDLDKWVKDSTNLAINKAELILTVDSTYSDKHVYTIPPKLILSLIDKNGALLDTTGQLIKPADLTFSESYYGGTYNKKDGTYRFNLAGHVQQLIKNRNKADSDKTKITNNGFYLTLNNKNSVFSRVVLKGTTSNKGIRFEVTYTKIR
ncbi:MAG: DUF4270 domain-containing protein [Candidatus Saccharibacteria bacterium]